jgi:hypothetical protein
MPKTIKEAINRGNNLLMVFFLALVGVAVFTGLFGEPDVADKLDDALYGVLAVVGVVWYLVGNNRYRYSWMPFGLLAVAFLGKVAGQVIENADPNAAGDELPVLIIKGLTLIVGGFLLVRARRFEQAEEPALMPGTPTPIPQTGETKEDDRPTA